MFEVRVAGRPDPLQEKVGKNRGVEPGNQQQQRYCLPTGRVGRQPILPRRKERSYLYGVTHIAALDFRICETGSSRKVKPALWGSIKMFGRRPGQKKETNYP